MRDVHVQGEHKKVTPCDCCWYFSNDYRFLHKIIQSR